MTAEPKKLQLEWRQLRSRIETSYMFSLEASINDRQIGEVPGGIRKDLEYTRGKVWTKADAYHQAWLAAGIDPITAALNDGSSEKDPFVAGDTPAAYYQKLKKLRGARGRAGEHRLHGLQNDNRLLEWFGLEGQVSSGGDWVVVRDDGVAQLSGRMTIVSDDEEHAVVEASFTGVVDLRPCGDKISIAQAGGLFEQWKAGTLPSRTLPIALSASFESATKTAEPWAPRRMRAQAEGAWKLARLLRGMFVAKGEATLGAGRWSPLQQVWLDVHEVGVAT
jgi:hypothetical protein